MQTDTRSRLATGIAALALVTAVMLVYRPGLSGPFLFDDYANIVEHPLVAIESLDLQSLRNAATSNESGPGGRPLAALSFALNYYLAGREFDAAAFKLFNVLVHAFNALLVLALLLRLLPRLAPGLGVATRLAAASAAALAWALHPLQLTSVLYVVQRMASLSATCVLAGLILYVLGRERLAAAQRGGVPLLLLAPLVGTGAGFLFKESAVLFPLFALVLELTAFRGRHLSTAGRRLLVAWHGLLVGLPGLGLALAAVLRPERFTAPFALRPFSLGERLLTESRVLFEYLGMLLLPSPGRFALLHDDVIVSRGLLDPPATLLALLGWSALVGLALWAWRRGGRVLPFALGWFLAGHALESTVFPLELMHEHRNYLASLGVLAGVVLALALLLERIRAEPRLGAAALLVLALVPVPVTLSRAAVWGDTEALVARTAARQPDSPRARLMAGQYEFAHGRLGAAYAHFREAARLEPADLTATIAMQHVIERLRAALAAGRVPASLVEADAPATPDDALASLRIAPDYLAALAAALDAETRRRLQSGTPSLGSLNALRRLRACVESGEPGCARLAPRALDWSRSLASDEGLAPLHRAAAAADAARILVRLGRDEAAREWLDRSWQLARRDTQVLVLRGLLEARAGDLAALRRTRDALAGLRGRPGFRAEDLEALDGLMEQIRAEEARG